MTLAWNKKFMQIDKDKDRTKFNLTFRVQIALVLMMIKMSVDIFNLFPYKALLSGSEANLHPQS